MRLSLFYLELGIRDTADSRKTNKYSKGIYSLSILQKEMWTKVMGGLFLVLLLGSTVFADIVYVQDSLRTPDFGEGQECIYDRCITRRTQIQEEQNIPSGNDSEEPAEENSQPDAEVKPKTVIIERNKNVIEKIIDWFKNFFS